MRIHLMLVSTALDSCRSCILEFYEESLANGPLSSHKLGTVVKYTEWHHKGLWHLATTAPSFLSKLIDTN